MLFFPRIRVKPLAALCHRLAVSTAAGIDDRRIWRQEAERGSRQERTAATAVRDAIARGDSVSEALHRTGDFYPPLFHQIVAVGETTGRLERTYRRLGEHYDQVLAAQRKLWGALAWPLLQLAMAIGVVTLLIVVMAALNLKDVNGQPLDLLGFGLRGTRGLSILLGVVLTCLTVVSVFLEALRRGAAGTRSILAALSRLPVIGEPVQTLAIAQFTWALALVADTPMDLRKALPLALDATGNDRYSRLGPQVAVRIEQGATIEESLSATGLFPPELLHAITVGEQSGMLPEAMQREAAEYRERAARAMTFIAQILGYLVWLLVAGLIIMLIFRIFGVYANSLQQFTSPNFKV